MRMGIIGTGAMAGALGSGWVRAGHEVMIGGRSLEKSRALAERIGAAAGTATEAAGHGAALLLAVPAAAAVDTLKQLGASLDERVLIDCTNALAPDVHTAPPASVTLTEPAMAERLAEAAPGARIVKAFNVCPAQVWQAGPHTFDGDTLAVPLCGDDPDAIAVVAELVTSLGLRPVVGGSLNRARYLEAMAAFVIGLWVAGLDPRAAIPPAAALRGDG